MTSYPLLDPASAALVIFGTFAATVMRCGWADTRAALSALAQLFTPLFDAVHARASDRQAIEEVAATLSVPFIGLWLAAPESVLR